MKNKKVFITGGAGFIGTKIAKSLAKDNKIVVYDVFHRDSISLTDLSTHSNVDIVKADVLDASKLNDSIKDSNVVIHLASIAGVNSVLNNPVKTMETNLIGTYNLLESCKNLTNLEHFLDFSTSEVFGPHADRVNELSPKSQGSLKELRWTYSVSKLAAEHLSHAYYRECQLPITCIRPFNIYGEGQIGESAVNIFIKKALKGEDITINADGSQVRAWCYIDDFVHAVMQVLKTPSSIGEDFNIGNPREAVSVLELAQKVVSLTQSASSIVFKNISYADVDIRIPDIAKAREILNFTPKIPLDDGLIKTIQWHKEINKV